MEESKNKREQTFRDAIYEFIDLRQQAKEEKRGYDTWLADAARRVRAIQIVTHPLKATHPDAKINETTSLYRPKISLSKRNEISSHCAPGGIRDVSGDAASLGVYKLLKMEVLGAALIDWFQVDDVDLISALNGDPQIARGWAAAFKDLIRPVQVWASHEKAKQVYWCVAGEPIDNANYHLLQPMFSSTLAHAVHADISDARFGENNTQARQAWRDRKPHDGIYHDYRGLIAQKLGGSNKQNVSQLNSERGGVNYLLASLPPTWDRNAPKTLLKVESALPRFARYEGVEELVDALCHLLKSNPASTMETRTKREFIEQALGQSLAAFGTEISARFGAGWTRDDECDLPLCEQLWLDTERAELPIREVHADVDRAFIHALEWGDWPDEIAHRFGNWLSAILHKRGLPVGDVEHAHWARQAIVDAAWAVPMQRRAVSPARAREHGHD